MTARDEILDALPRLRASLGRDYFTPAEVLQELRRVGSIYSDSTIRTHVVSRMCSNAPDNHEVVYEARLAGWPPQSRRGVGHCTQRLTIFRDAIILPGGWSKVISPFESLGALLITRLCSEFVSKIPRVKFLPASWVSPT
jgi:hypothetical protein